MDNLSIFIGLLALITLCALPMCCELPLDENPNYDIGVNQFHDYESLRIRRSQDHEQAKTRKGKQKVQEEENYIEEKESNTGKHKKQVVKSQGDVSTDEEGKTRGEQKNENVNQVVPDGKFNEENEETCVDDSDKVKPQVLKGPTKKSKREIKPWNYNALKAGSRKRNDLEKESDLVNNTISESGYPAEDECVDEVPQTKKPTPTPTPEKTKRPVREINPSIANYLKSFPSRTEQNETRFPKKCVHNDTSFVVQETVAKTKEAIAEEECNDEDKANVNVKKKKNNQAQKRKEKKKAKRNAVKKSKRLTKGKKLRKHKKIA